MSEPDLKRLVDDLGRAARASDPHVAGRTILGVRAVEPAPEVRWYLAAVEGPAFLCLSAGLRPAVAERQVREVGAAVLLCERAEEEVDIPAMHAIGTAAGALLAHGAGFPAIDGAVREVAHEALALAAWRAAPARALASLVAVEEAIAIHGRLRARYGAFVTLTEPLAAAQADLDAELRERLGALERAVGAAGVGTSLAARLGDWIADCDEGAAQIVAAHLTPLTPEA